MAHSNTSRCALRAAIGTVVLSTFLMTGGGSAEAADVCISQSARDALTTCQKGGTTIAAGGKPRRVEVKSAPIDTSRKNPATIKPKDPAKSTTPPPRDERKVRSDARARPLLVAEIQGLESLFATTPRGAPDRAKLMRRLAEDYVELESAAFRDKIEAEIASDEAKKKRDAKQATALRAEAGKADKILAAARLAAIKYYTKLKDEYPKYCESPNAADPTKSSGCTDEVLYYLAYEHEQASQTEQARKVYLELIQSWPQSKYIPNAYLAFGELFFNEAQGDPTRWSFAEQSYNEVIKYPAPENKVWAYAHYKLGYVAWNKGEIPRALAAFKKTIEHGMQYPKLPNAAQLASSARRDIIPVFALSGDPKRAHDFFRPLSGDSGGSSEKTFQMLDDLGQSYLDTGHYKEAIDLYEDLMSRDRGPKLCKYQGLITDATLAVRSGNKGEIKIALDKMLETRDKFIRGDYPDAAKQKCSNTTAGLLTETAMAWHLEAVGTGDVRGTSDKKTMNLAASIYDQVVQSFTQEQFAKFEFPRIVKEDWPNIFKVKYARADLLYFNRDWEKCGPAFDAVVAENPTGPLAPEAAYAAVLCYQNLYTEKHKDGSDRPRARALDCAPGDASCASAGEKARYIPRELTSTQKGMLSAFNRYFCYVKPSPNDKAAQEQYADVAYARGYTYFEAQHWEEAALAFRDVALKYSDREMGIHATQLYLESLNVLGARMEPPRPSCYDMMAGDIPKLVDLYCKGDKEKANADQCGILRGIRRDLEWRDADITVKKADAGGPNAIAQYEAGAAAYMEIWRRHGEAACEKKEGGCKRMDEVLYNASRAFQAARLIAKSIAVKKILLNPQYNLDKTEVAKKAIYEIGGNYQAIAVYDEAASYYERFAGENPRMEKAAEALQDAVVLRLGLGQEDLAIRSAELFQKSYGSQKPAQSAQISFAIGAHYAEREDWENARRRLKGAMASIDRNAAIDVQILAHATLGRVLVKMNSATGAAAEYAKVQGAWRDPQAAVKGLDALGGNEDELLRRRARVLTAVGEAMFFFAEQKRKDVDRIRFPEYKGSGTRDDVLKHVRVKVKEWINKKRPAIQAAEQEYFKVVKLEPAPPPRWVIASGARVGQMWGKFVAEFRAAPIPKEWKGEGMVPGTDLSYAELRAAYYEELDKASEPQKLQAKSAFETCLQYSVKYMFFDEHSRSCEVWLSKHYASQFHLIDELRGAPTRKSTGLMDRAAPLNLDGTAFRSEAPKEAAPAKPKGEDDASRKRIEAK
jgi:TolA-binding protein